MTPPQPTVQKGVTESPASVALSRCYPVSNIPLARPSRLRYAFLIVVLLGQELDRRGAFRRGAPPGEPFNFNCDRDDLKLDHYRGYGKGTPGPLLRKA